MKSKILILFFLCLFATSQAWCKISEKALAYYYFIKAQRSFHQGLSGEAIRYYQKTLKYDPGAVRVMLAISRLYLQRGEIEEAKTWLEKASSLEPQALEIKFLLVWVYINKNLYSEAIKECKDILAIDKDNKEAMFYLANLFFKTNQYYDAIQYFKEFLRRNPESHLAYYYLGNVYLNQKRYKDAESAFKKSFKINPHFEDTSMSLARLYKQWGKAKQEERMYQYILSENPRNLDACLELAKIYLKKGRLKDAQNQVKQLEAVYPEARLRIGAFWLEQKQYHLAIEEFKNLLEIHPQQDNIKYYLGYAYGEGGDEDKAIKILTQIRPTSNAYTDAVAYRAYLLKNKGETQQAIDLLEETLRDRPKAISLYLALASILGEEKAYPEAEAVLKNAISIEPNNRDIHFNLGIIYDKMGNKEQCIKEMREVLVINPHDADALNYIGYTYAEQGKNLDEAESLIKEALKYKPEDGYIIDSLGWVYFKQKRHKEALKTLEKAHKLVPKDPIITEHLGDVYLENGLLKEALSFYEKAIKLNPKDNGPLLIKIRNLRKRLKNAPSQ